MKLSIIIPAYNESQSVEYTASKIRPVISKLQQKYDVEVLFINDGSSDDTVEKLNTEFADSGYARVISYQVNKGLGEAMRTGFKHATGDVIVTTDFDGTYKFETIAKLLACLEENRADIATASPYHPMGAVEGVPRYRLMFSFGASLLYRMLVNPRIHTWTALFRAYRRPVIESVSFENDGFLSLTEILVNSIRSGYQVCEFPTMLHTRQFGQSSIRIAQVTKAHLKYQSRLLYTAGGLKLITMIFTTLFLFVVAGIKNISSKRRSLIRISGR